MSRTELLGTSAHFISAALQHCICSRISRQRVTSQQRDTETRSLCSPGQLEYSVTMWSLFLCLLLLWKYFNEEFGCKINIDPESLAVSCDVIDGILLVFSLVLSFPTFTSDISIVSMFLHFCQKCFCPLYHAMPSIFPLYCTNHYLDMS